MRPAFSSGRSAFNRLWKLAGISRDFAGRRTTSCSVLPTCPPYRHRAASYKAHRWEVGGSLFAEDQRLRCLGRKEEEAGGKTLWCSRFRHPCHLRQRRRREGQGERQKPQEPRRWISRWRWRQCSSSFPRMMEEEYEVVGLAGGHFTVASGDTNVGESDVLLAGVEDVGFSSDAATCGVDGATVGGSEAGRHPRQHASCSAPDFKKEFLQYPKQAEPTQPRSAPGSRAPTVSVVSLWRSQLRRLLSSRCGGLRSFIFSSFKSRARKDKLPCSYRPVWPMPLPYDDRRGGEDSAEDGLRVCLNSMVLVLNWLALRQPVAVPSDYSAAAPLNSTQWQIVTRLRRLVGEWTEQGPITSQDMGRAAGKMENVKDMLDALTIRAKLLFPSTGSGKAPTDRGSKATAPVATTLFSEPQLAKDIEAGRLSFSGRPTFDPTPFLGGDALELYNNPLTSELLLKEELPEPPHVQVRGCKEEVRKLLKALDTTGRLALVEEKDVRHRYTAGLFCLMKSSEADRLIMDARPSNTLEPQICDFTYTMAAVPPLLQWQLPQDCWLMTASEDLKDFYYFYRVSRERSIRNTIEWRLPRHVCSGWEAAGALEDSSSVIFPALQTMAMGDLNSVEYGQQSHVRLAFSAGLTSADLLTLKGRGPRPTRQWMAGIVIDDLVILEQVPAGTTTSISSTAIADSMVSRYEQVGLVSNSKKRVREATSSRFWGVSLEGKEGLLRAQLERTVPLASLTMEVASLGVSTRKLLEVLLGSWVAIMQCRRRCMCLLFELFREVQEHTYEEVFQLAEASVAELWTLVVLSPLMVTDLKATVRSELVLVDASDDWMAEVSAPLPKVFASELVRHQLTKVAWARLLSPWKALQRSRGSLQPEDEVPEGEPVACKHPLWSAVIKTQQFCLKERQRVTKRQHINVSELKSALQAERRNGREQPDSKLPLGSDSQVTLGAMIRGRSSSKTLNDLMKAFLPDQLAFNTYSCPQYVHTSENVADDPTRNKPCRLPELDIPNWLRSAFQGHFEEMDVMLQEWGLDDASIAELPLDDQKVVDYVDPLPPREEVRRQWVKRFRGGGPKAAVKSLSVLPVDFSHGCHAAAWPTELCKPWVFILTINLWPLVAWSWMIYENCPVILICSLEKEVQPRP